MCPFRIRISIRTESLGGAIRYGYGRPPIRILLDLTQIAWPNYDSIVFIVKNHKQICAYKRYKSRNAKSKG